MSCLSLTWNKLPFQFRRCRNYATLEENEKGQPVRNFFCKAHAHSPHNTPQALVTRFIEKGYACNLEFLAPWVTAWLEELLQCGYVEFTRENLQRLEKVCTSHVGRSNVAIFLLLMAKYTPGFSREWCPTLWYLGLRRLWKLRQSIGPFVITDEDIASMICVKGDMEAWITGMLSYPDMGTIENRNVGWSEVEFYRFLQHLTHIPKYKLWYEEWILSEFPSADSPLWEKALSPVVRRFLQSEEFHRWRAFEKKEWYSWCERILQPIKEELIVASWEPSRVVDWCVDNEDRARILSVWQT